MTYTHKIIKRVFLIVMIVILLCTILPSSVLAQTNLLDTDLLPAVQNIDSHNRSITNPYGFILPLDGLDLSSDITSPFGLRESGMHYGVDFAWPGDMTGVPIRAVLGGTANSWYDDEGYGYYIVVDHGIVNGVHLKTLYAHMSKQLVSTGNHVTQGDVIGLVGDTGGSRGAHLHFEVIIDGVEVDPIPYLTWAGNAPPDGSPVGQIDSVTAGMGTLTVQGWAYDSDRPSESIEIHVYIGGPAGAAGVEARNLNVTDVSRPDVNTEYNVTGNHGFNRTFPTNKRGVQTVYVYAINLDQGSTVLLGTRTVEIPTGNPLGNYEHATTGYGTVTVKGWAFDPDQPSSSINIHVYIGGTADVDEAEGHNLGATDITRTDVNEDYHITGVHGFHRAITTNKRGTQDVYVYAMNFDNGTHTLLGHITVNIPTGNPIANYDSATGGVGTVTVRGWAFDPDQPSASIRIDVYIGGPADSPNANGISLGMTDITRNDVNNTYNISGAHGFNKTIPTDKTGTQDVYVYAINVGAGTHTLLGTKTVTIT